MKPELTGESSMTQFSYINKYASSFVLIASGEGTSLPV
jgi:hypothetical protein